jgi:hypothetical protein
MEARVMRIFTPVTWLWTLPHPYTRPWVWLSFIGALTLSVFLWGQSWFIATIHARFLVEVVLSYRDLQVIKAGHRRERHEQTRAHIANCPRCRSLQRQVQKNTRAIRWGFSC